MEERVRDLLTDNIGYYTIKQAKRDLELLLEPARQVRENRSDIERRLAQHDISLEMVEAAEEFYEDVLTWLEERVDEELRNKVEGYGSSFAWNSVPNHDFEIQLRDPKENEPDEFTQWAESNGYGGDSFRTLSK